MKALIKTFKTAMRDCAFRYRRDGMKGASAEYWLERAKFWRDRINSLKGHCST